MDCLKEAEIEREKVEKAAEKRRQFDEGYSNILEHAERAHK